MDDPRRRIPRTDAVLADARIAPLVPRLGHHAVRAAVRLAQDRARAGEIAPGEVVAQAVEIASRSPTSLRPVLNATGVVLHTNLGRAPLAAHAVAAIDAAAGYVDVEYDVVTGGRAARGAGARTALAERVPAAEDVHVVNNGAAALVLAATALAAGREIVISRGEMVEIGDGFRIPDLLASTGARLREVGTTNRTRLADYGEAVGPDTAFVVKVHPSNFRIEGFTRSVPVGELASLGVPVVADIGSGLLEPDPLLPDEPDAASWLGAGAALVTASGDKLLGGPQAGLVLGRRDLVQALRRHPLARALRVDKVTLAALEATLRGPATPTDAALRADPDVLRDRAQALARDLGANGVTAVAVASRGAVGGGGAPGVDLPGWAVEVDERLAVALRAGRPCVVGRTERGRCLLDLRCVPAEQDGVLQRAVEEAAQRLAEPGGADRCT